MRRLCTALWACTVALMSWPAAAPAARIPTDCSGATGDVASLVAAIDAANANTGPDVVELRANCVYTLTAVHNSWFGPNGLPPIASDITIEGSGAKIVRSGSAPAFRLFFVGAGGDYVSPGAGTLTLRELTLSGGIAKGGDSNGGGGGAGLGGAIFNQGTVVIERSTLTGNSARGGSAIAPGAGLGGGGISTDSAGGTGGGFGPGSFPLVMGGGGGQYDSSTRAGGGGGGGGGLRYTAVGTSASVTIAGDGGGDRTGLGGFGPSGEWGGDGSGGGAAGGGPGDYYKYSSGGDGGSGGPFGGGGAAGETASGTAGGGAGGGGGVGGGGGAGGTGGQYQYVTTAGYGGNGGGGGFAAGGGAGALHGSGACCAEGGEGGFGGGGGRGSGGPGGGGLPGFGGGRGMGADGGGGAGMGGAIFNMQGDLTIRASTLAANRAIGGADNVPDHAKGLGGAVFNLNGSLQAVGATLAGNSASNDGSSLYNLAFDAVTARVAHTTMRDTIAADSGIQVNLVSDKPGQTFDGQPNLGEASAAVGELNLVRSLAARELGTTSGSPLTADPLLGPLQNNGGPTQTMAPAGASPVVDRGSAFGLGSDQRGLPRPVDFASTPNAGDGSDVGAVELQAPGSGGVLAFGPDTLVTLELAAKRTPARGPIKVRVANGNDFVVAGKLRGETPKKVAASRRRRVRLKAKTFNVAAHARKTVRLALPKPLRKLLARRRKLTLRLIATVTDPAANSRTVKKRVALRLKKPRRR